MIQGDKGRDPTYFSKVGQADTEGQDKAEEVEIVVMGDIYHRVFR